MSNTALAQQILRTLKLPTQEVANMYLVGSRLYKEHVDKTADYDVIIVRTQFRDGKCEDVDAVHRNNIDAVILSHQEFSRRIQTHLIERMCLSLPEENILMETSRPSSSRTRISWTDFTVNAKTRHEHTLHKARKFQDKGKHHEMRKLLLHSLRDARLFAQSQSHPENQVEQFRELLSEEEENADDDTLWSLCELVVYES